MSSSRPKAGTISQPCMDMALSLRRYTHACLEREIGWVSFILIGYGETGVAYP